MTMTPLSVLELMPTTSEQVESFSGQMIEKILNGEVEPAKILYYKKLQEKTFDAILENEEVKDFIEREIDKHGKEGISFNDTKFELAGRKSWDYSQTGDSYLFELEAQKKELEQKIKDRQKLLQTAKKEFADVDTGEIIYPASYSEKTYIKSSIRK